MIQTFFNGESFLKVLIEHINQKVNQIILSLFFNIEWSYFITDYFFFMQSEVFIVFLSWNHEKEKYTTWPNIIFCICNLFTKRVFEKIIILRKLYFFIFWWLNIRRFWEIYEFEEIIIALFYDHYVVRMNQIVSKSFFMTIVQCWKKLLKQIYQGIQRTVRMVN